MRTPAMGRDRPGQVLPRRGFGGDTYRPVIARMRMQISVIFGEKKRFALLLGRAAPFPLLGAGGWPDGVRECWSAGHRGSHVCMRYMYVGKRSVILSSPAIRQTAGRLLLINSKTRLIIKLMGRTVIWRQCMTSQFQAAYCKIVVRRHQADAD